MVGMEVEHSKNPLHSSWQPLLFSPIKNNNPLFNRTSRQDWFVRRMGIGGAFAVSLLVWAFLNDMRFEKFWIRLWVALKTMAFQHWLATHVGDKQNIRAARHPYQSLRFRCGSLRRSTKSAKRMFFATSTFCDHDRHGRFFQSHWRSSLRSSSYPELLKLIQFLHHPAQKAWHWPQCRHKFPCCCICRFLCFNTAGCWMSRCFTIAVTSLQCAWWERPRELRYLDPPWKQKTQDSKPKDEK